MDNNNGTWYICIISQLAKKQHMQKKYYMCQQIKLFISGVWGGVNCHGMVKISILWLPLSSPSRKFNFWYNFVLLLSSRLCNAVRSDAVNIFFLSYRERKFQQLQIVTKIIGIHYLVEAKELNFWCCHGHNHYFIIARWCVYQSYQSGTQPQKNTPECLFVCLFVS